MIVIMIMVSLFVFGLIVGSFVGAFTWRLHKGKDWVKGRSECESCHHTLAPKDLVPVFSWLLLGGKCRYCHKAIGWDAPLLEVITGLLFALSYAAWPWHIADIGVFVFAGWIILLTGLIALAVYDIRWMLLPDKVVLPLSLVGLVWLVLLSVEQQSSAVVVQGVLGGVVVFTFFYALFQVSGGKWIGGGDVKLGFLLGVLAGTPLKAAVLIFIASILGCIVSIPLIILKGKKISSKVPFGPFLIAAAIILVLFGTDLINLYKQLLLL